MEPIILENRLLSSLQSVEDVFTCQREGVTTDTFAVAEPDHSGVWEYIETYVRENKSLPLNEDLLALFSFESTGPGDLKTYVKEARASELGRKARAILISKADALSESPIDTIRSISAELSSLQSEAKRKEIYLDKDAKLRLDYFDEAHEATKDGGILGIPTGLGVLDKQGLGFKAGQVVVVLGGTGVGKSWLVTHMATTAYDSGYKVLMISPELTAEEVGLRFDVLLAAKRGVTLSNQDLILGKEDRTTYRSWLKGLAKEERFIVIDASDTGKPLTFNDLWRYAIEYTPDLLVVDGLQLIYGSSKIKAGWEILKEGIEYLKALAQQEKLVCLVAHQADRSASRKDATVPPSIDQIAHSFDVARSADRIISIARVAGNEMARVYRIPKLRAGKDIVEARMLKWDVDHGVIRDEEYVPDEF